MKNNTKQTAKLIKHIEDTAALARKPLPAYIGCTRDGLKGHPDQVEIITGEDAELLKEAREYIQSILDAKHACPNSRFGGYGGKFGALFEAEFAERCPAPNLDLAARLESLAARLA